MSKVSRHSLLEPGNLLIVQERERMLIRVLREHGYRTLEHVRVFEAGVGGGYNLRQLVQWGAKPQNLAAVDINPRTIELLRTVSPNIPVDVASADNVPAPDTAFDIALAFTLFSSVSTESTAAGIAAEMTRVTRPGGLILVYDMRRGNPRNRNVHAVTKADIRRWFPRCPLQVHTLTLAPPIARPLARHVPQLYGPLAALPPLRTHALYVLNRPAAGRLN